MASFFDVFMKTAAQGNEGWRSTKDLVLMVSGLGHTDVPASFRRECEKGVGRLLRGPILKSCAYKGGFKDELRLKFIHPRMTKSSSGTSGFKKL